MAKQLMYSDEARRKMLDGANRLAKVVGVTMGPAGRWVAMEKSFGGPAVVNDGVSVAKEVELKDPFENVGAQMLRQVANKTKDVAGDGTSTATILAREIYARGLRYISAGANPMALKRGLDAAVEAVLKHLKDEARPCKTTDDLRKVATVSAGNDPKIGNMVAEAMEKVGRDGVVTVEEAKAMETVVEVVQGMRFDKGYISPYFITNAEDMTCVLEDCMILVHEKKLSNLREMLPFLEKCAAAGKPLLIIAEDVESEALAGLVINRLRGVLRVCAVKAPGFGDRRKAMLGDIAIMTGGKFFSEDLGVKLENIAIEDLGRAEKVTVDKDNTTIVKGAGKKADIQARIAQIKNQIETTTSDYDREKLQERLAKLSGGVGIIKVGAPTEAAMKEAKTRIENAVHATKCAWEEGILPGGGLALLRAQEAVERAKNKLRGDEKFGADVLMEALEAPMRQIADNAGVDGTTVVETAREKRGSVGYDAAAREFTDMWKAGVVDAAKVVRVALQNAASAAGLMLTAETVVTELKEEEEGKKLVAGAVH
ncbi:MAG: chaperonin GroEL [Planctomycetota bacterium]|nr:chaperonin GroEL [Planctomycetota bacterium]